MKAWHWLQLPWMGWSQRTRRLLALAVLLLVGIVLIAMATSHKPDATHLHLLHLLAIIDCLLWALVLPRNLLLANEAHRLRLPSLRRAAIASVLLYVVLTIILPAGLMGVLGTNGRVALTELALGAGIGMGYAVLPYWLGFWACLTPTMDNHIGDWLPLPGNHPAGFVHWAAPLAAVLWLAIALSWRFAVRGDDQTPRWLKPTVFRWRTVSTLGRNHAAMEAEMLRRRGKWQQATIDLRGSGPGRAVRSLRIALGGWHAPKTLASLLRQAGKTLLVVAFVAAGLIAMQYLARGRADATAHATVLNLLAHATALGFGLALFGAMLGFVRADFLRSRWSRANAELALLGLLPGLGNATQARHAVLMAGLRPTLLTQAAMLAGILGVAAWQHLPAGNIALLLLAQGGAMLATVTLGVSALGDTALRPVWQSVLTICASVLIITTCAAALFRFGDSLLAEHVLASSFFAATWTALLALLLALGRRGWRAYRQRAHPFLPNAA